MADQQGCENDRVRERLRVAILEGKLTGKLPGERALAKTYDCNVKTVAKALRSLPDGWIECRVGVGRFVTSVASGGHVNALIIRKLSPLLWKLSRGLPNIAWVEKMFEKPSRLSTFDIR